MWPRAMPQCSRSTPSFVTRRVSQTSDAPGARNNITLVIQAKILKRPLQ
jgi:hypothetical protein